MIRAIIFDVVGVLQQGGLNQQLVAYIRTELKPHYRIGVLSSVGPGWLAEFLDKHQLHDLFDEAATVSPDGFVKPHPSAFLHIAEQLGCTPQECVMIDDSPDNCAGAEAVGMKSILYTSNEQCYRALGKV